MKIDEKIIKHFEKLVKIGEGLTKNWLTSYKKDVDWTGKENLIPVHRFINYQKSSRWGTSCLHFLKNIFTEKGEHYLRFKSNSLKFESDRNIRSVSIALGIMEAAKYDYENGNLFDTRTLIEAEVFDEFLEQAEELFKKGYYQPAAVIAGCVLEDGLRKLGQRKIPSFSTDKTIDPMNVELAKAGIYNTLWQKKITALADLRNKAAHGKWTEFTEKDVEDMIRDVRRFMEDYFS